MVEHGVNREDLIILEPTVWLLRYDEMYGITSGAVPRNAVQTVL